jgi:hypothetical protein
MSLKDVKPFKAGTDVERRLEKRAKLWPSRGNTVALTEYREELAKVGQAEMDRRYRAPAGQFRKPR